MTLTSLQAQPKEVFPVDKAIIIDLENYPIIINDNRLSVMYNNHQITHFVKKFLTLHINEPAYEIVLLIASSSNESTDKPAQVCRLARAYVANIHK